MRRTWKNFLSLLLAIAMILSLGATAIAEPETTEAEANSNVTELSFEKVDNDIISERLPLASAATLEEEEPLYADEDIVRVSIVLNGLSAIDAGYAPASAGSFRAGLKAEQDAMANRISAQALDGAPLDVVWNITLAGNMISAYVPYGSIEDIKNVNGVRDVVLELQYFPTEDEVESINATEMTGATAAWNLGYTGAGSKIAVVDTGLDIDHQSFDPAAFQHAIDELNETRETPVKLMTAEDVAAVWGQLNASTFIRSEDGVYRNAKVPFAVNYVDKNLDATHLNDAQGEHGSHVAGIAAANKYIPNGDGFDKALETVFAQGEAPDAQLLIMKVFGSGGGAYDSDYMVAVEDAMTMGCDAVNLSLGSSVAGYTTNATYAETLNKLTEYGLVWANSAGNNYSWTQYNIAQYGGGLYADDVNYQTGGSPATYHNTLSVASVDNKGQVGYIITASDDSVISYTESTNYGNGPLHEIPGEYTFIMLSRAGYEEDDFAALGSDILNGNIAIAWRGGSSFYQKCNAAIANGAVASIVANNTAGAFGMNLTGYSYTAPAVSILQNDGVLLQSLAEEKEANGVTYYEGKLTVQEEPIVTNVGTPTDVFQTMSSFSSWGGNGALTMKPEITAPGGSIWSVWGANSGADSPQSAHDQYENMSGTSMASPQVAGLVAVLGQYIRETGLEEKLNLSERQIAQSLLMSTAIPLADPNSGYYWSILKQGAGLANVNNAITARSLIQVTDVPDTAPESAEASIADGKVKVEIGEVNNSFSTAFTVTNFSDDAMSLYLNGEFFTQYVDEYFRTEYAMPFGASIFWTVNGEAYTPASPLLDFNGDGYSNALDAQHLLNWCADDSIEIYNLDYADLDEDGNVDTHDAKIAFETLNGIGLELAAGETVAITADVAFDLSAYDDINGNYVEGFFFVREGETNDGALGVEHSIPVFGFNGNFSDATMFDRGSRLEYLYGFGDGAEVYPYMYYAGYGENALDFETFLVQYADDSNAYYFGGNPMVDDDEYMPERNALNANDMLYGLRYTQIRNAGASRFYVTDKDNQVLTEMQGGASYAAYYYASRGTWQQVGTTTKFNYIPASANEGDELTAHYQLALEYYVNADGSVRWDDLGKGSEISIPFVIDNTAPEISKPVRDTNVIFPDEDEVPVSPVVDEDSYYNLSITAKDNQYIAAIALFTDEGELLDFDGSDADAKPGDETTYTFDLVDIFKDEDAEEGAEVELYPYLLVQVYDYASNLSTYKVNLKEEVEGTDVTSFTVTPEEAVIYGANSLQLEVDVRPWGLSTDATWTSSDETVATVDENGRVTGVGDGTATITAVSKLDPNFSDTCEITVQLIDKELNGVVWDEEGKVWFSEFNLKSIPEYTKLNETNLGLPMASLAYDENNVLYGATLDTSGQYPESALYTVNTTDWTVEEIGATDVGYMDICQGPALSTGFGGEYLWAVYGPYLLIVDKTTGDYLGYLDATDPLSLGDNALTGIAYFRTVETDVGPGDQFFLVDDAGNLYLFGYAFASNGGIYRLTPTNLGNLGYTSDWYFQSLYFDGASLYWSCFTEDNNKVDMIVVDLMGTGEVYKAGSFADGVWPVGGLFELNDAIPADGDGADERFEPEIAGAAELLTNRIGEEKTDAEEAEDELHNELEPIGTIAPIGGGLDFSRVEIPGDAEIEKIDTSITVEITAEELSTNGKIIVDYDPKTVTLISATPYSQYRGILDQTEEAGHYVLAWVDLEGIEADGLVLKLKFATDSNGIVTITTCEENERDADADENLPRVEEVVLGNPEHQCPCADFEDMPPYGTTEHDAIDWAFTHDPQITNGIDPTHFGPEQTVTRGQAVTFLWRAAGCPQPQSTYCPFTDVKASSYYYTAMLWAIEEGITNGTSPTTFSPSDTCTRAQIITFVYRFRDEPEYDTTADCPYTDVKAGSSYYGAMMWALQNGIEVGTSATTWEPKTGCTRAAIVTYLYRIFTGNGLLN